MPNILVIGGAGYIGSHTAKLLAEAGYQPVVFDHLGEGHRWAVQFGPLVQADLADKAAITAALRDHKIEAVIHFASYIFVGESMKEPAKYFRNNTINSMNLLEAMHEEGINKLVFSSTAAVYGEPEGVPIPEDHPKRPVNPYGESKYFVERLMHWFDVAYGFKSVALRYFNAAGADRDGKLGESHRIETHLIPLAIEAALGARPQLEIYGDDYPTFDGTAVRDYIHVCDLASAHIGAIEHLLKGGGSDAFNLGTGRGRSVKEVVASVERVGGKRVPHRYGPRRAGDPPELVADPRRAFEKLGWKAQYQDLDSIVETAWKWHAESPWAMCAQNRVLA